MVIELLRAAMRCEPFPWQRRLLKLFSGGSLPAAIDVPTGLGKTMTMAVWLVARATGAAVPRRLVYVVDRRAVVDQATAEAERLAQWLGTDGASGEGSIREMRRGLALPDGQPLPVSTLRGQFVDNRHWLEDPALPAIVVGTVDMIGSRLLFEGYGVSRRMRPVHAGLLGADALIVLDEAHLVPPFEALLADIANAEGCRAGSGAPFELPAFHLLPLSATGHHDGESVLTLDAEDEADPRVRARLHEARKPLAIEEHGVEADLPQLLAERAWELRTDGGSARRVLVFCDLRDTAQKVKDALEKKAGAPAGKESVRLLVGARRVKERQALLSDPAYRRFIADDAASVETPTFLVATSAGEVGVDLDADAMVCDLVAWERMVQRFGRVNRRPLASGARTAPIIVVVQPPPEAAKLLKQIDKETDKSKKAEKQDRLDALTKVQQCRLAALRQLAITDGEQHDASTGELRRLKDRALVDAELKELLAQASTPNPVRPALSRALVDAWSMTSLEDHPGRPKIQPWLRGWVEDDEPQVDLVWRRHLPWRPGAESPDKRDAEAWFDAAPVHLSEVLETETWRAIDVLHKRARAVVSLPGWVARESGPAVIALDQRGAYLSAWTLDDLASDDKKKRERMTDDIAGCRLVVQASLGGLDPDGLLDPDYDEAPPTLDDEPGSQAGGWTESDLQRVGFRVVVGEPAKPTDSGWRRVHFWPFGTGDDAGAQGLRIDAWRAVDAGGEAPEIARVKQGLAEHHQWAGDAAREIGRRLSLPEPYIDMLVSAARGHDAGKDRAIWQDSVGADRGERPLAKSDARGDPNRLKINGVTYRHEFGSLADARSDRDIAALPDDLRDLALHLIASHHGFSRPLIAAVDPNQAPSASDGLAREAALRFARLQKRWGPWGLAWWEAVFRAADWAASKRLNQSAKEDR